jgi:hypothetical protein
VANGSHRPGPAQADRIREELSANKRLREKAIQSEAREQLQSYDDGESEITGNWKQVNAKLPLPRQARMVIGVGLGIGLTALLLALAVVAVLKVWPR